MRTQWKSNVIVGAFIVSILSVFLYFIMNYTNELGMFETKAYIHTKFEQPQGLFRGSSVQLSNVKIGRVTRIEFPTDIKEKTVYITMIVKNADLARIGKDAVARINTAGLLGDAMINIDPGHPEQAGQIRDGDWINSEEYTGFLGGVDTEAIGKKLTSILDKIDAGGIEAISSTLQNASDITAHVKEGKGSLGGILYSDDLINKINATVADLNSVIRRVNQGPGSAHTLVYKDDVGQVLADLKKVSDNLSLMSKQINAMVSQINDEQVAKKFATVADNLQKTSDSLAKVAQSIESGQGTIGMLIQDPSLYDDLKVILGGAKRSEALKYVVQHTIKMKQKAAEGENNEPPKKPEQPAPAPQPPKAP